MPEQKQSQQVLPTAVWGKVITELRTKNSGALFIACGEIDDVNIENNNFVIKTFENNKLILDIPENLKILQEILNGVLPNYDIVVQQKFKQPDLSQVSMQNLKRLFGNKLTIINKSKPWQNN